MTLIIQVRSMILRFFLSCLCGAISLALFGLATVAYAQTDGAPPFAFKIDSMQFSNPPVRLAGAMLKPDGNGPFPAIVIAHGAGPGTFDEPAFRVHANAFVRGGFAVLLYDKRGSGRSTGMLDTSDYDDLAADLGAGVMYLRSRGDIIRDQIGILGRSEGGWIGTLAASRDPQIRFVILSSGSGVRPSEQTLFATAASLRSLGASTEEIEAGTAAKAALWAYYARVAGLDSIAVRSSEMLMARDSLAIRLRSFARFAPIIPQIVRDPTHTPPAFFRAFTRMINYDPAPAFHAANVSLLEIIGEKDEVIEPASTIAVFEGLQRAGRDVTVRTLPGVGHSLVIMTKDGPRYPEDYPEFAVRWARAVIDRTRK
ncbi:MAG: alpha/beta fold hydrolase [Bacteroidetes bacterium]|nr:alpha/beta fold hydrolase [Bacteroidota bacterium]